MKATEVAEALLKLAAEHDDPHVYAYTKAGDVVQAVEPMSIGVIDALAAGKFLIIQGVTMAEFKAAGGEQ